MLLLTACGTGGGGAGDEAAVADRVTLVVPTPPGSSFDTWARAVAPEAGEILDTDVVVDNQPGASGLVALNHRRRFAPGVSWQLCLAVVAERVLGADHLSAVTGVQLLAPAQPRTVLLSCSVRVAPLARDGGSAA